MFESYPFASFVAGLVAQAQPNPDEGKAWIASGAIVVLGLLIFGLTDVLRFRLRRVRALAGVCFRESVRRRVLWITPLAIVGVIIVSQLQRPLDEQDAIRQTLKFCLFATGALVAVTGVILACTNLPKEIETRVIYTIVTKPVTRLEIVLGKVAGFAAVSGAILLIMGVFTYGYLHLRAWSFMSDVDARLANVNASDPGLAATLRHYKQSGLLTSATLARAADLQVYSRPSGLNAEARYMSGGGQGDFIVPFRLSAEVATPQGAAIQLRVGFEPGAAAHDAGGSASDEENEGVGGPKILAPAAATLPSRASRAVSVDFLDANLESYLSATSVNGGQPIRLTDPTGMQPVIAPIDPSALAELQKGQLVYVRVTGANRNTDYFAGKDPVQILVPAPAPGQVKAIAPSVEPGSAPGSWPRFRTRATASSEQQLRGSPVDAPPGPDRPVFAVYRFRGSAVTATGGGTVGLELKGRVERSGADSDLETPTRLEVIAIPSGGSPSTPVTVQPESNRTSFIDLPAASVGSGDFDVQIRCTTAGHFINLGDSSLVVVTSSQPFALNLLKSLGVLWLLAILVVVISIFCSTFLSWPIAIVLTIVILLGHWGVQQLGDVIAPGIGNAVVTDMFGAKVDPNVAKTVSSSVEKLAQGLNLLSMILPDITRFSAIEDIERGLTVPAARLIESAKLLLLFGLPMIVLSYVFLRNKEVAP